MFKISHQHSMYVCGSLRPPWYRHPFSLSVVLAVFVVVVRGVMFGFGVCVFPLGQLRACILAFLVEIPFFSALYCQTQLMDIFSSVHPRVDNPVQMMLSSHQEYMQICRQRRDNGTWLSVISFGSNYPELCYLKIVCRKQQNNDHSKNSGTVCKTLN